MRIIGRTYCAVLLYVTVVYSQGPTPRFADLDWDDTPGATSYKIYRSTTSGVFTAGACSGTNPPCVLVGTSIVSQFTDGSVVPGQNYFYAVTALVGVAEGAASDEAPAPIPLVQKATGLRVVVR